MRDLLTYLDPSQIADELKKFEAVTPTLFRAPGFVADYLQQPNVQTASIKTDDAEYVIAFHISGDKGFWVDLAKCVRGSDTDTLFQVIQNTAARFGCTYIRFTTMRTGLIELAKERGFIVEAVLLTKAA